jgi:hypothetical protein
VPREPVTHEPIKYARDGSCFGVVRASQREAGSRHEVLLAASASNRRLCPPRLRLLVRGAVVAECVRPQPDERLADADVELGRDHAGGLVHHRLEVRAGLQLSGELSRGCVGLQHEERLRGDVGHDERVGILLFGERSRSGRSTD